MALILKGIDFVFVPITYCFFTTNFIDVRIAYITIVIAVDVNTIFIQ